MPQVHNVEVPKDRLVHFCHKHHIRKLALFGSVLREDFRTDSDVDVLVEFDPDHTPGFIRLYQMEQELSLLLGNRKLDLVTERFLNPHLRDRILQEAQVQYAQG